MRSMQVEIGGKTREMVATFKASMEIAQAVGDPVEFAQEVYKAQVFEQQGLTYNPRFKLNTTTIPQIIHIGLKAGECKAALDDVQEWCFDKGMVEASADAINYLNLLVTPRAESAGEGK